MRQFGWVGRIALAVFAAGAGAARGYADTVSYTGILASPENTFTTTVTLTTVGAITLQTYGFGGGVNAAGTTIAPGGFDAFVGIFSGTGDSAVFEDGTSDILTNFSPGCPPAGTVTIGSVPGQCGDVDLEFPDMAPGTYTVLLTDAAYLPAALFEGSPGYLGDGFIDLTPGVFQTCYDEDNCNTDTANWALDVTGGAPPPVPEPWSIQLAGLGMIFAACWMYRRDKEIVSETNEGVL